MRTTVQRPAIVLVITILLLSTALFGTEQIQTGNVAGLVRAQDGGGSLSGASVTLEAGAAKFSTLTNPQGQFRFKDLPPGTMRLTVSLPGFSTLSFEGVKVTMGRWTNLEVEMASLMMGEPEYTVSETLLDERRGTVGIEVKEDELRELPTSRDPWTILELVPGVQVDRLNIGGNESSQQSTYVGTGSMVGNNIWSVEGVVITDMAALGTSPSYFDFDALQEIQVTTGGVDSTVATSGVVVNLVTKRGTAELRGSARYLNAPGAAQSQTSFNNRELAPSEGSRPSAFSAVRGVDDFGAELGGAVLRDHLWFWGSFGNQKSSTVSTGGVPYDAELPTYSGKINSQIGGVNSLILFAIEDNKSAVGRDGSPTRPLLSTWDQGHSGANPTIAMFEDTQIFSPSFYSSVMVSEVNGGFHLTPIGSLSETTFLDAENVWHNSFVNIVTTRPQRQAKVDASEFLDSGSFSHELKFGASYRHVVTTTLSEWSGGGVILDAAQWGGAPGDNLFQAARAENLNVTNRYVSAYVQDTAARGPLTLNVGLRYDRQSGSNNASTEPANPFEPGLLPVFQFAGSSPHFSWSNLAPRIGANYALGENRDSLVRIGYARFADQLGAGTVSFTNPTAGQSFYYSQTHGAGPGNPTPIPGGGLGYSGNVNPATGLPFVNNAVGHDLSAGITDEGTFALEHSFFPELVGRLNLTYRRLSNLIDQDLLVFDCSGSGAGCSGDLSSTGRIATRSDYEPVTVTATLPSGAATPATFYTLKPGVFTRNGGILVNGDRTQMYQGLSVALTKRLANRWMLRGNLSVNNWKWGNTGGLPDPTEGPDGGAQDGDPVLTASGAGSGPKAYVYIGAKWTANLNGLYQVMPERTWSFNVAGNITARQGYPLPLFLNEPVNLNGNYPGTPRDQVLAVASPDSLRLPNVYNLDARIEKQFAFQDWGLTLGVDCFNLFNSSTVLQRVASLGSAAASPNTGDFVYEILSPRIFRFGARLTFR